MFPGHTIVLVFTVILSYCALYCFFFIFAGQAVFCALTSSVSCLG